MEKVYRGSLVRPKDSFRVPKLHECGIVIDYIDKANGGFNCVVLHPTGEESSIAPSGLEPCSASETTELEALLLASVERIARRAIHQRTQVKTLLSKRAA